MAHNAPYSKKLTEMHWVCYDNNVPSLNTVKILTVRLVENFILFESTDCLPARLSAIRPTSITFRIFTQQR